MILREKDKQSMAEILKNTVRQPAKVWAYGSRVNGLAHDMSDLDLVIITQDQSPLALGELTSVKEKLTESNIPILVQVLDWARIPENFRQNILNNHEELFELN